MADLSITAANVKTYAGADMGSGQAGEAITAGQTLYRKAADGKLWKADDTSIAKATCLGVALNNAAADQPVSYAKAGGVNPGAAVIVGTIYGLTDTAGGISTIADRAAGDYITLLGVATTTSRIDLRINASGVAIAS